MYARAMHVCAQGFILKSRASRIYQAQQEQMKAEAAKPKSQ